MRPRWAAALVLALVVACTPTAAAPVVAVGVGATLEQRVLGALTVAALDGAGVEASVVEVAGGTRALRGDAIDGDVDVFWDYTGAAWSLGFNQQDPPADPLESYERVRREDAARGELEWLAPSGANATLALFVRPDAVAERTLSELSVRLSEGDRTLCADAEWLERTGGLRALADVYPIDLAGGLSTEAATEAEAIAGVAGGRCDVGLGTATSGEARSAGVVAVADDLVVFPAFVVAPVVRQDTLAAVPAVRDALARVTALVASTDALATLNARAVDGEDPAQMARSALDPAAPAPSGPGPSTG